MNRSARQHLDKAAGYVAKGEEFYRKAAEEIVAARKADPQLSDREIGERFGKGSTWVARLVTAHTNASRAKDGEFAVDWQRGNRDQAGARKFVREATPKEIAEELLADPQIRAKVSKAQARVYDEQATTLRDNKRERDVERKGGEKQHAKFERRQRVSEIVNVARGAASGLRFVAGQAKTLQIAEDDSGVADELRTLLEEIDGFVSMLRSYLAGEQITDADIAALIGEKP